jgi:hypothetical protein
MSEDGSIEVLQVVLPDKESGTPAIEESGANIIKQFTIMINDIRMV